MFTIKHAALAGAALGLAAAASAQPVTIYSEDFEGGPAGPEWTGYTQAPHVEENRTFSRFLGRYSQNNGVTLSIPAPARSRDTTNDGEGGGGDGSGDGGGGGEPDRLVCTLLFDLYAIDSWDGSEPTHGEDSFLVLLNGVPLFDETIANQHNLQTMRRPDLGPVLLEYNSAMNDSIYRDIPVVFEPGDASVLNIQFRGDNLLSMNDESWGIDNVRVSYEIVPAPGAAALLGVAGVVATRRRRRA